VPRPTAGAFHLAVVKLCLNSSLPQSAQLSPGQKRKTGWGFFVYRALRDTRIDI
jgi:hypothetical protein